MISTKQKPNKMQKKQKLMLFFTILKWLLIATIVLAVLFLATSPLRGKAADDYVSKGDILLLQKKYISAEVEFKKALTLNPSNAIANDHINLARKAALNIGEFERFFDLPQFADFKNKYEIATDVPSNQSDAVKLSKKLIEDGEYQLAIMPAKTALEMDQKYRDAWLYLGIANLKAAQLSELKPEAKNKYLAEAKMSFTEVLQQEPDNQTAKGLLEKI